MNDNSHIRLVDLQNYVSIVFGSEYKIKEVSKLYGGAQKTVYKIDCSNHFSCILYVWDISENYFKEEKANEHDNERSFGSDLFQINNQYLRKQGITTPILYHMNDKKDEYPFDFAFVEYIEGEKLESYLTNTPLDHSQEDLLSRVGAMIQKMHSIKRDTYGNLLSNETSKGHCHQIQFNNAKDQLLYASQYLDSYKNNVAKLNEVLHKLESLLVPRDEYGFVHWELGPDHVLVNERMEPYLIDIEGAKFFDIEYEHSFLEFRFDEQYNYFKNNSLDQNRMRFYRFYHHIALTTGGLKLLHRGFPNQKFAKSLIDYHSKLALQYVEHQSSF
ncbi:phosphotransferase [Bacillus alkalicellulosilyticus]|uniref:phosphotransferase n=1 Tax=Alkalihalobacterium alkalicellulosilyticum TaxID=1912214 RepID=UPI000998C4BF|nr:phosphotransferase [Bacillus alkalicellulosilyticus]